MQTFITTNAFMTPGEYLDKKRTNKQVLEGIQILQTIISGRKAWSNHPAVNMWRPNPYSLFLYTIGVMIRAEDEFNIKTERYTEMLDDIYPQLDKENMVPPQWIRNPVLLDRLVTSHRANLYFKDPELYHFFKIDADYYNENRSSVVCHDRCNYFWPTHLEQQ